MDTIESILTRRSIRQYTAQKVPEDKVKRILQAAMYAPSAMNLQPWHFIVIDRKELIEGLIKAIPHADMLKQAPLVIIYCGDTNVERNVDYIVQDCSASIENSLLAAHAIGLGAVWIGIYPDTAIIENLRKHFELPANIIPVSAVAIGFPSEVKDTENRYNSGKIHINKW